MRTIEQKIYNYQDLLLPENSDIKDKVINKFRYSDSNDFYYIWNESEQTVKAFLKSVNVNIKTYNSWLEPNLYNIDDNIIKLSGLRLRKWFINNFDFLYKPKYIGCLKTNEYIRHKRIKSPINVNSVGNRFNPYYSGCQFTNCCTLTGACYDDSLLSPIYEFIKNPNDSDFEDVIKECFNNLEKDINNEIDYQNSEQAILETIEANNYEFNENGEII